MDRNQETNILSSATFGNDKPNATISQERNYTAAGEFDYHLPSRGYGMRTQPSSEIG